MNWSLIIRVGLIGLAVTSATIGALVPTQAAHPIGLFVLTPVFFSLLLLHIARGYRKKKEFCTIASAIVCRPMAIILRILGWLLLVVAFIFASEAVLVSGI